MSDFGNYSNNCLENDDRENICVSSDQDLDQRIANLRYVIPADFWNDDQIDTFAEISSLIGCKESNVNELDLCWQSKFFPQDRMKEVSKKNIEQLLQKNSAKLQALVEKLEYCKPTAFKFKPEHFIIFGSTSASMQKRAEDLVSYLKNNNLFNTNYKISILTGYREVYKNGKIILPSDGSEKFLQETAVKCDKDQESLQEFDLAKNIATYLKEMTNKEIDIIDTPKPIDADRANTLSTLNWYLDNNAHSAYTKTAFISHNVYTKVQSLKLLNLLKYYPDSKDNMAVYGSGCDIVEVLFLIMPELAKILHISAD